MSRYTALLFAIVGIILLAACGMRGQESAPLAPEVELAYALIPNDGDAQVQDQTLALQPAETRIVLKNASLTLVVDDAQASLQSITQLAETVGGWVVTSNTSKTTTRAGVEVAQGAITIRVPADNLNDVLSQIKAGAISVDQENVTGQDVTQDYIDLTSQLGNLNAAEAQLQSIMEDANRTEDVLAVYNDLVRIRGEIETTQGRIRYYEESAAYSSISVILTPQALETTIQIAGWSPGRTAENALASLINILRWSADLLITVAILVIPLLLIFGIPVWLIYRTLKRRGIIVMRPAHNQAQPAANPPLDE
jgi:hypothetical protein